MRTIISILFFLTLGACVDRIQFDITRSGDYGIVLTGFVSDEPGPYTVTVSKAFDIESKETIKTAISVKRLVLSDNQGSSEELSMIKEGTYQTKANGIRGYVGRVYTLRVELLDGKIYESVPDTLPIAGKMDTIYYSFGRTVNLEGSAEYGFDVFANALSEDIRSKRFI